ncbi:class A beta-lactamase [Sphingorhabdus sp.]|uniref:class A beta-lactamase n=1 Tax=Sphingorhabdus sp. TaxID=1902408 RepID=UPI003BB09A3E|nr:class A beta-lactamase [Sphingomonadales bacterium]MBK9431451.1 class A beta-lactamase [Sphingomonadales bacterium]
MTQLHSGKKAAFSALMLAMLVSACASAPASEPRRPTALPKPQPSQTLPPARPAQQLPAPSASPNPQPMPEPVPSRRVAPAELENRIHETWRTFPGRTGIAVYRIDGDWMVGKRQDELFPQQSVSKMWVSLAALDQVDRGQLRLDQMVKITSNDLAVFHQPIRERVLANGVLEESVLSLMEQAITASDNTANDSLLRTIGGPEAVRDFLKRKNLDRIRFGPGERLLQSQIAGMVWKQEYSLGRAFQAARAKLPPDQRKVALDRYLADPIDGASPAAIARALGKLAIGDLLSPASTRLMLSLLERVKSGPNRLKAGVPAGWKFGHKTGTGQELEAVSTGYNDIGIMTAPDGTRYAVTVMIADTTATVPQRMQMMQAISRSVAETHR